MSQHYRQENQLSFRYCLFLLTFIILFNPYNLKSSVVFSIHYNKTESYSEKLVHGHIITKYQIPTLNLRSSSHTSWRTLEKPLDNNNKKNNLLKSSFTLQILIQCLTGAGYSPEHFLYPVSYNPQQCYQEGAIIIPILKMWKLRP